MSLRPLRLAAALLAAFAFSSCGAANSLYETADRAVQALGRTVTAR